MPAARNSLIHPAYRHLERTVRIASLTLLHWTLLTAAGIGAWVLGHVLPFSATYDLSIALSLTGAPAAVAIAAGTGEAKPFRYLRDVIHWRRTTAVYEPAHRTQRFDPEALWD